MDEIYDYIKQTLPSRITAVRSSYSIPIKEVVWVCNDISVSAFTAWEAGIRTPAIDGLYDFAINFGVSIDWLCGASEEPYDADFIFHAERSRGIDINFLPNFIKSNKDSYSISKSNAVERAEAYADIEKRIKTFSPNARANLLVLIPYIKKLSDEAFKPNIKNSLHVKLMQRLFFCSKSLIMILMTGEASCLITPPLEK